MIIIKTGINNGHYILIQKLFKHINGLDVKWMKQNCECIFNLIVLIAERPIEFEEDEESEPEVDMGTTQVRFLKNGDDTYFLIRYYNSSKRKE